MPHCNNADCLRCDIQRVIEKTQDLSADKMPSVACVLAVLLGAMSEGSEAELAALAITFGQGRLREMDKPRSVN